MKKSRFSEQQIATALRHVDAGAPIAEVIRALGHLGEQEQRGDPEQAAESGDEREQRPRYLSSNRHSNHSLPIDQSRRQKAMSLSGPGSSS